MSKITPHEITKVVLDNYGTDGVAFFDKRRRNFHLPSTIPFEFICADLNIPFYHKKARN